MCLCGGEIVQYSLINSSSIDRPSLGPQRGESDLGYQLFVSSWIIGPWSQCHNRQRTNGRIDRFSWIHFCTWNIYDQKCLEVLPPRSVYVLKVVNPLMSCETLVFTELIGHLKSQHFKYIAIFCGLMEDCPLNSCSWNSNHSCTQYSGEGVQGSTGRDGPGSGRVQCVFSCL